MVILTFPLKSLKKINLPGASVLAVLKKLIMFLSVVLL